MSFYITRGKSLGNVLVLCALLLVVLAMICGCGRAQTGETVKQDPVEASANSVHVWDFQNIPPGGLPVGWKVEATNRKGALADWRVRVDKTAPGSDHVLVLTDANKTSGETFNLCWTDQITFGDGEIQVHFKAMTGQEDQGGGVMWRAKDKANYYIARFNPLEDNFRLYRVLNGVRRTLAGARISLTAGSWHTMKIAQHGQQFAGYLDGNKLLEGTDDTFKEPGGVGVWTKADAATAFAGFSVRAGHPGKAKP